jgi:DNA/RNA-binding domain of Phe-tRNA-synthetase-like protein
VLPSVRQLDDELPSAEDLKQRLERGESIDSLKPTTDGDGEDE